MVDNHHKRDKMLNQKIDELESLIASITSGENNQSLH